MLYEYGNDSILQYIHYNYIRCGYIIMVMIQIHSVYKIAFYWHLTLLMYHGKTLFFIVDMYRGNIKVLFKVLQKYRGIWLW